MEKGDITYSPDYKSDKSWPGEKMPKLGTSLFEENKQLKARIAELEEENKALMDDIQRIGEETHVRMEKLEELLQRRVKRHGRSDFDIDLRDDTMTTLDRDDK